MVDVNVWHLPSKEEKSVTILDAIHYITAAWQDLTEETVQNCSKKQDFYIMMTLIDFDDPEVDIISLTDEDRQKLLSWRLPQHEELLTRSKQCLDEMITEVSPLFYSEDNDHDDTVDEEDVAKLLSMQALTMGICFLMCQKTCFLS